VVLRKAPRLLSRNKLTDPDQVRLREYLDDTAELVSESVVSGPWALLLDVGLAAGRDLLDMADLDNYAHPLASRLRNADLVSVWCTKRHGDSSRVVIEPARAVKPPMSTFSVRTTASAESTVYKEQVRSAVAEARELPAGAVKLEISFVVGPRRNWLNLWKPTIDALDPLLGRTRAERDWHPQDGRITELGLHVAIDPTLEHDIDVTIAAGQVSAT
jgi:hypothetical protein